jgi:predicted Zn-dependent protease
MKSLILRFTLACSLIMPACYGYDLPDLGNSSYSSLPSSEEQRLGTLFMQEVRKSIPLLKDPVLTHYLNELGKKLASNSKANQKHFDFFIVDSADINAFAGPAGHVGVNVGTILLAKNEDELAAVLAHEITHVSQHHLARAMENARGSTLKALATMAAALVVGSMGHGDAAMGGLMAAQTLSMESQLGYSRDNEREADRIGMQVMHKSHYDPQAMPRFLTRMSKQQFDLLDGRFSYLRTHPVNEERIADAKSRAESYPKSSVSESLTFQLMQKRLLAVSTQPFSRRHLNKSTMNSLSERYGYALLLHHNRNVVEAEKLMRSLVQEHPDNTLFALSLAEIYSDQHRYPAALEILEKSYRTNPDYPPLVLNYSTLLNQQNHSKKALNLLEPYVGEHKHNNVYLLEQLALAQAKTGNLSRAYLTRAKLYSATDQPEHAQLQIQQALKYAKRSEKEYIKNEIERIKDDNFNLFPLKQKHQSPSNIYPKLSDGYYPFLHK